MPHHRRWCSFVNQTARWRSDSRPRSGRALMSTALFPYLVAGLAGALLAIAAGAIACGRVHAKVRRLTDALDHMSQGLAAIATFRMSMETLLKSFGDSAAAMKSTAV